MAEFDGHVVGRLAYIDLGSLDAGKEATRNIFIKCLQTGVKLITFQVGHTTAGNVVPNGQFHNCQSG